MAASGIDPRRSAGGEFDIRPVVATSRSAVPLWLFAGGAAVAGLLLFSALDSRRRELSSPSVRPRAADQTGTTAAPPQLYIPPAPVVIAEPVEQVAPEPEATPAPASPPSPPPPPQVVYVPSPPPQPALAPPATPRPATGPVLIIDTTTPDPGDITISSGPVQPGGMPNMATATGGGRASALRLRNRPTTVPQGTLIPAVLETALDSTRPGQARALVSRDVKGFDGSRVLIPRGSRLFGEYRADLAPGQNRALVMWTRLVRPDGVTIALASPAADALGRAGIKGSVNSHFFERFGAAILQSALDVGVNIATAKVADTPVIVGLGNGGFQSTISPIFNGRQVQPTLKVRQGVKVTVFVARDLDFTGVETRR